MANSELQERHIPVFRFLDLPRELRDVVFSLLKVKDLGNVGLANRVLRTGVLPYLFHTITPISRFIDKTPRGGFASFPLSGLPYVRKVGLAFPFFPDFAPHKSVWNKSIANQMGTVPYFINAEAFHVDCSFDPDVIELQDYNRPLGLTTQSLQAITKLHPRAVMSVYIEGAQVINWQPAILAVFRGLATANLVKLDLQNVGTGADNMTGEVEQETCTILTSLAAGTLQRLEVHGSSFLASPSTHVCVKGLRELAIHTDEEDDDGDNHADVMRSISRLLEDCRDTLSKLLIEHRLVDDSSAVPPVPALPHLHLSELRLAGDAYQVWSSLVPSLDCKYLIADLPRPAALPRLAEQMRQVPVPFPLLHTLHLKSIYHHVDDFMEDCLAYSSLRLACIEHGVELLVDFSQVDDYRYPDMADLWYNLAIIAGEIANVSIRPPPISISFVTSVLGDIVEAPKLHSIELSLYDGKCEIYDPQSASLALQLMLLRLSAPNLREMELYVSSARTEWLEALVCVVTESRFPSLRVLKGRLSCCLAIGMWEETIRCSMKTALLQACGEAYIDTSDLTWTSQ